MRLSDRRPVAALVLAAAGALGPAIGSCQGGSGGTTTGSGGAGAGGAGGSSGVLYLGDAGSVLPDGCGGPADAGGGDGSTGCEGLEGGVTYPEVAAIFSGCQGEVCHGPPTHDSVVGVVASECCDMRALVAPGNAAQSYLLDKVLGVDLCEGAQMPLEGIPLADAEVLTLRRWICEGAPAQ